MSYWGRAPIKEPPHIPNGIIVPLVLDSSMLEIVTLETTPRMFVSANGVANLFGNAKIKAEKEIKEEGAPVASLPPPYNEKGLSANIPIFADAQICVIKIEPVLEGHLVIFPKPALKENAVIDFNGINWVLEEV